MVFDYVNDKGETVIRQSKALELMGVELPEPGKKLGRFNNRKMTFDKELRAEWIRDAERAIEQYRAKHPELARTLAPLDEIEREPEKSREALEKNDFIAAKQKETIARQNETIAEQEKTIEHQRDQIDKGDRMIEYQDAFREFVQSCEEEVERETIARSRREHDIGR